MPDIREQIQGYLNSPNVRENLTRMFVQTLKWGNPSGGRQPIAVGAPVSKTLTAIPVAQVAGLAVFRLDWDSDKRPTVLERRAVHKALAKTATEHLLCYVMKDGKKVSFVWARQRGERIELRTLPFDAGSPARTTVQQLAELAFSINDYGLSTDFLTISKVTDKLNKAFDVEAVKRDFFDVYRRLFEKAEAAIKSVPGGADGKRLFTQRLFNRLMFIVFLERKGWLSFNGQKNYLQALWQAHVQERLRDPQQNFYRDRLFILFFAGLNTPHEQNLMRINKGKDYLSSAIGEVPYLNGGLFEEVAGDTEAKVPDAVIEPLIDELFYRFNFTVTESTPFDIEVAVDPEMLGKIFEELVTGRHETGSYYTPKPVVSFMCRESLRYYLRGQLPDESAEALSQFVETHDSTKLKNAEATLEALRRIKVCDPACGSGAYLLGMMHELLDLRASLFASKRLDAKTVYERKLEVIQTSLYGVDKDEFAVNIARLRLWLSLVVDYESNDPPPLPNLDFKIEAGDTLTARSPSGSLQPDMIRHQQIEQFQNLKENYMRSHGNQKIALRSQIDSLRTKIGNYMRRRNDVGGFEWSIEFAEVFEASGFDIVVANPPYIRMELFIDEKPALVANFGYVHVERADYYVYFYARAHELLKPGGVACFISSNKWLRAGYGEKLREFLLDQQAFHLVVDFGELPVFEMASTFPAIFLWQKLPRGEKPTQWATVKDLQACYDEGIHEHVGRISVELPASQFVKNRARFASATDADRRKKMELGGQTLNQFVNGRISMGIKTGLNEAFIIDNATRQKLVQEDKSNLEVIKPHVAGDDIRRYEIHFRDSYLLYLTHGIAISQYDSILKLLRPLRNRLENRATQQKWYELQQPQAAYAGFFNGRKIVYPDIGKETRFVMDTQGYYGNNTTYFIGSEDWYLLAILNSSPAFEFLKNTCAILGDENDGGRLRFFGQYLETLPIPRAVREDHDRLSSLAKDTQRVHGKRWKRVEKFLGDIGLSASQSSSRNVLEQPWTLKPEDFKRKAKNAPIRVFNEAQDETVALTEEIQKIEKEIDERVEALYGL